MSFFRKSFDKSKIRKLLLINYNDSVKKYAEDFVELGDLDKVADRRGITRERVRQCLLKFITTRTIRYSVRLSLNNYVINSYSSKYLFLIKIFYFFLYIRAFMSIEQNKRIFITSEFCNQIRVLKRTRFY